MSPIRLAKPLILGVLALSSLGGPVQAEQGTAQALMPWEGDGRLYPIGPDRVLFIGRFEGIMYVQTGGNRLDGMLFECPAIDEFSVDGSSVKSRGYCILTGQYGDTIFAEYTCKGTDLSKCKGEFKLTAGTGQFEGITGSGPIESRSVLSGMAANTSTGHTVEGIAGIAILPELKFNIPERK
jgi:hypothetical protein